MYSKQVPRHALGDERIVELCVALRGISVSAFFDFLTLEGQLVFDL